MGWEILLLVASVTILCLYTLGVDLYRFWRDRRRAQVLGAELRGLAGKQALDVERRFGPPTEVLEGSSGRSLHVWKGVALPGVPRGGGLLVVTLTVGADGTVADTHWQQRGRD